MSQLKGGDGLDAAALDLTGEEKAEVLEVLGGDVYLMQSRRARYILLRLDEILANGSGATYEHSTITIEHVLPRTPGSASEWITNFTYPERQQWTHKLGNLLLLNRRKNSAAGTYDFTKKKAGYFATSNGSAVFALTTQVLQHAEWTPAVVEKRQRELIEALTEAWDLT